MPFNTILDYCNDGWILTAITLISALVVAVIIYMIIDKIIGLRFVSDLNQRYILITGCDTGFGEESCRRLDLIGCHVVAGCLTEAGRRNLESRCSTRVRAIILDVTDDKSIENAVVEVTRFLPEGLGLWGIVNNAGEAGNLGPLEWCSNSDFDNLLNLNFISQFKIIKAFLPLMRHRRGGGRIVNTSSILGCISIPYAAPYCISKHAIESMSDCLRLEVLPYNISVSVIEPGTHKSTKFISKIPGYLSANWNGLSTELKEEYGSDYMKKVLFLGNTLIPLIGTSDNSAVINSYVHALLSRRPHRRYFVGYDAFLLRVLSWFPSFVKDIVFSLPGFTPVPKSCYVKK